MSEATKTFQILDSNSIKLIIQMGTCNMFWKMHVYVYKISYCDKCCMFQLALSVIFNMKAEWKTVKDFEAA